MIDSITPKNKLKTTDQLFFNEVAEDDIARAIDDDLSFIDNFETDQDFEKANDRLIKIKQREEDIL